jgi:hypothetical protein
MYVKQILIDIGIVLVAPALVLGGYFVWGTGDSGSLLSDAPTVALGPNEPGAKTKLALDTLRGIVFDDSLFKDEAFTSLTPFYVTIPEVPLSRDNPFVPPPVIAELLRNARNKDTVKPASSTSTKADPKTIPANIDKQKKLFISGGN